ncbi:hypothetical protein B0H19DRAFT_1074558 [Mycena capillaripes]|nr:hypothetical protein B0H19DRAFT_1074558 [Mycena capillaripes]
MCMPQSAVFPARTHRPCYHHPRTMIFELDNLRIQFMLEQGPGVQWLNQFRRGLYPGHGPAHISVVPRFTIHEDDYEDLLDDMAESKVAAQWEPFEFEAVGMYCGKPDGCVAILVRNDDGVLEEIMDEIPPLVQRRRNRFPPHVTIYKGSQKETYFPFFREILGFQSLQNRLESKLN